MSCGGAGGFSGAVRDNLTARIAEAEREGWPGERTRRAATVSLGIPAYRDIAARTAVLPGHYARDPA